MLKPDMVAVNLSVTEWKVLSAILDEASEGLARRDDSAVDILQVNGFSAADVPDVQALARLGAGGEYDGDGTVVEDFLILAGLHKKIKDQAGLDDGTPEESNGAVHT
jgi:hypothetical protein